MSEDSVAPVLRTARLTLAMPPPSQAPQVVAYLTRNHARYASTSPDRSPPTVVWRRA